MVAVTSRSASSTISETWDRMKSHWRASTHSTHRPTPVGVSGNAVGGDYYYANETGFLRMIELIRWYERNDPVVQSAFSRLTVNVCQQGFTLDPNTSDKEVDRRLYSEWLEWATDPNKCCARGSLTFDEMSALGFRSKARDGDAFAIPLKSMKLKLYEGHRCRTPSNTRKNVVHGILLDEQRKPKEYWFTKEPISPHEAFSRVSDTIRIPAYDKMGNPMVFHLVTTHRDTQTRGVSWMAPAIDYVEMGSNINFAKMVQQQTVSCYALINKRSNSYNPAHDEAKEAGELDRDKYLNKMQMELDEIGPGMIYDSLPGEELTGFSPNIPNAEFFDHAKLLLTFLSMNLSLPINVLLLDPSDTNFSGWRGAIDQARQEWRVMQRTHANQFHRRVYHWWVRNKLAREDWLQEAFRGGVDIYKHDWKLPAWEYIEPHKDAMADMAIVHSGMGTRRRTHAKRGISYDEEMPAVFNEIEYEVGECMAIADRLNGFYEKRKVGQPADWREIAQARGILPSQVLATLSGPLGQSGKQGAVA